MLGVAGGYQHRFGTWRKTESVTNKMGQAIALLCMGAAWLADAPTTMEGVVIWADVKLLRMWLRSGESVAAVGPHSSVHSTANRCMWVRCSGPLLGYPLVQHTAVMQLDTLQLAWALASLSQESNMPTATVMCCGVCSVVGAVRWNGGAQVWTMLTVNWLAYDGLGATLIDRGANRLTQAGPRALGLRLPASVGVREAPRALRRVLKVWACGTHAS